MNFTLTQCLAVARSASPSADNRVGHSAEREPVGSLPTHHDDTMKARVLLAEGSATGGVLRLCSSLGNRLLAINGVGGTLSGPGVFNRSKPKSMDSVASSEVRLPARVASSEDKMTSTSLARFRLKGLCPRSLNLGFASSAFKSELRLAEWRRIQTRSRYRSICRRWSTLNGSGLALAEATSECSAREAS